MVFRHYFIEVYFLTQAFKKTDNIIHTVFLIGLYFVLKLFIF